MTHFRFVLQLETIGLERAGGWRLGRGPETTSQTDSAKAPMNGL